MRVRVALGAMAASALATLATAQTTAADTLATNPQEALGLAARWLDHARTWIVEQGPIWATRLVVFVLILALSSFLARWVGKIVNAAISASKFTPSHLFQDMAVSFSRKAVFIVGLLIGVSQLGIDLAPLLAGLGVGGFIVGFAAKDTLSNLAAGIMILFYRPFDEGDFIEAGGVTGTVQDLSIASTTIVTPDNQLLIVPNSAIWGGVIRNVTAQDTRRVDLVFGIGYDDDIEKAERTLSEIVAAHELVLAEPPPMIKVHELADSSVNFVVRPWTKTEDYWTVYWDLTRTVKMTFDREGISIPFPQRDVHLYHVGPPANDT